MLLATQGFVLHTVNYSESSVIVKIFTRHLGTKSYLVKGVRSAKSRVRQNLFQPLTFLDLVVYNNPKKKLNFIKDIHLSSSAASFCQPDAINAALRFFMTELLYKTLREDEPNVPLFEYMSAVQNSCDPNLPVSFLLHTAHFLGVEPRNDFDACRPYFDLREGSFLPVSSSSSLNLSQSMLLHQYLDSMHTGMPCPLACLNDRIELINLLLNYYQLHVADFSDFHSHHILHSVLA